MKHNITKFFTRLALVAGLATAFAGAAFAESVTFNFSNIASANNWVNGTAYTPVVIAPITLAGNGGGNNAKYYTSDQSWRMYNGGTVNITAASGYEVTAVSSTPSQSFTISNGAASLSCTSTIKFTAITVTYRSTGGTTPTTYTVSYDANGGSGTMTDSNSPYASGATVTVLDNAFTRAGHSFSKWNSAADGTGTDYDEGDTFTINANTTLYAQWTAGSNDGETLVFDFEDNDAHRTSGSNSYSSTNSYSENGVDIELTYADAVTSGTPISGIANVMGRVAKNTTNRPVVLIGPISISNWTISKIEYKTKGVAAMTQLFETSLGGSTWTTQKNLSEMPTSTTTETVSGLSITGSELYLRWTVSVGSSINSNRDFQLDDIVITYTASSSPSPVISASNVDLLYGQTSGSIAYEVANPVSGATLQASVASGATISNMAIGTITDRVVPFTCDANATTSARSATVTLNYVKDNEVLATKNVTVTQAAAPVIYSTIPALFAAATSTETEVHVTFNNWVVSGVSTNGKNVFVTDNSGNGFVIFDNTGGLGTTYSVGAILSGANVTCNLVLYNGFAEIKSLDPSDLNITTGGSVSTANIAMADLAGVNTGALVSYQDLVCSIDNNKYYLSDGTTTLQVYNAIYAFGALESGKHYNITGIYQQYNSTKEILPRSAADIEEVVITVPTITVAPATANHLASEESGSLSLAFENLTISDKDDFGIVFYDAEGNELSSQNEPGWIAVEIDNADPGSLSFVVSYIMDPNTVTSPRTAYFKVFAFDDNSDIVYSNLVTITQAAYVIDYAELPFEWAGGTSAELGALVGVTTSGLGSDYAASNAPYRVKLDGEGDYVLIKTDSRPGKVSIGVKMLGGTNTSKIKVQGSADGETFTDVEELTISGSSNTTELNLETSNDFAADARYVKIIKSVHGSNVGVGPITIAEYVAPAPSITLSPAAVGVAAVAASGGRFNGTLAIRYSNLPITKLDDFEVIFCDSEGEELQSGEEPDWILIDLAEDNGAYVVSYVIYDNDGAVRRAYIKVWALDEDGEEVYSNLVTITQAEYVAPPTPGNWVLTSLADLTADDVFVIVNDKDERASYAMSNDNGASVAPDAVEVSVLNGTLTGVIPANIRWNVRGNDIDGYVFYPDGSTESWLYCTNTNNGVRVGDGDDKYFTLSDNNYLTIAGTGWTRYLGVYKTQDWRCYTNTTGDSNIANQTIAFYKKQVPADAEATITVNAAYHDGRYWATFYNAGAQYELPEGAQAFTMNADHELYRLGDKGNLIPENTAVIILTDMGEIPANGVIPATKQITLTLNNHGAAAVHGGENILRGSSSPKALTSVGGTPYVMGINNEGEAPKLGFFPYNGTGDNAYIPANKAYYVVASE